MVVHRLLTAAIAEEKALSKMLASNKEVEQMSQHINKKNRVSAAL